MPSIKIVLYLQSYPPSRTGKVRWVSGLNHQFAKLTYGITVPGVRIPPSPRNAKQIKGAAQKCGVFLCSRLQPKASFRVARCLHENRGKASPIFALLSVNGGKGSRSETNPPARYAALHKIQRRPSPSTRQRTHVTGRRFHIQAHPARSGTDNDERPDIGCIRKHGREKIE